MLFTNSFDLFILIYCWHIALAIIYNWKPNNSFVVFKAFSKNYKTFRLLNIIRIPFLNKSIFIVVGMGLLITLILTGVQWYLPLAPFIGAILFFFYFSQIRPLANVRKMGDTIPLVLLTIAFSYWYEQGSLISPELLIKIIISQIYFSAGIQKLMNTGLQWGNGKAFRSYLMEYYLWGDMKLSGWLSKYQWICGVLSTITLLFEVTFPIILFFPGLELIYAICGILFHIGTGLLLKINYLIYYGPIYWIFFVDYMYGFMIGL